MNATRDTDPALTALLDRQRAVISWRQARRHLSESTVRHRVASGSWRRVHRGVFLAHAGPIGRAEGLWVASLAVGNGRPALLGGSTALRVLGLRLPDDAEPVHVLLPAHLTDRDPPPGVVVHRSRHLPRADARFDTAPPCTTAARSLVDAARWAFTDAGAVSIIAATFQQRLVTAAEVNAVLGAEQRIRRRSVIESAVADASGGSESAYEIEFLRLCRQAGLPRPSRQTVRRDRSGRNRYRDVYFDVWRVQIEIDGAQHMDVYGWGGMPTCEPATRSPSAVSGCSASPAGPSATARGKSSRTSGQPCTQLAGAADSRPPAPSGGMITPRPDPAPGFNRPHRHPRDPTDRQPATSVRASRETARRLAGPGIRSPVLRGEGAARVLHGPIVSEAPGREDRTGGQAGDLGCDRHPYEDRLPLRGETRAEPTFGVYRRPMYGYPGLRR
ncbi:hypothetical protein Ait01nite_046400 [Actinoplanes italicus]|nr:hypothetical protein Ait01nite_046400 [Actinoplanes italicus]